MYILVSIHIWPVGLNLFASAHIHPLPARALLVSLRSVLGPLLFSIYTSPISTIAHSHKVCQQQYADDTQLYVALSPVNYNHDSSALQSCLTSLQAWFCESGMASTHLSQSPFSLAHHKGLNLCLILNASLANTTIPLSDKVKILDVTIDSNLTIKGII